MSETEQLQNALLDLATTQQALASCEAERSEALANLSHADEKIAELQDFIRKSEAALASAREENAQLQSELADLKDSLEEPDQRTKAHFTKQIQYERGRAAEYSAQAGHLRERLAKVEEDTKRLDWAIEFPDEFVTLVLVTPGHPTSISGRENCRSAIDAALADTKGEDK
jgi:chromosome segregation ATPase